ncbi:hypothetical protein RB213_009753 [Colletotrichum asianum]
MRLTWSPTGRASPGRRKERPSGARTGQPEGWVGRNWAGCRNRVEAVPARGKGSWREERRIAAAAAAGDHRSCGSLVKEARRGGREEDKK